MEQWLREEVVLDADPTQVITDGQLAETLLGKRNKHKRKAAKSKRKAAKR